MKELITTIAIVLSLASTAQAQTVPGMPALTKPVSSPQEVSAGTVTTTGGALSLAAPATGKKPLPAPAAKPKGGSGVTQQMVDRSKKPDPVPQALAAAALDEPVWAPPTLDTAVDLSSEVGYQRNQLMPGRSTPGELSLRPGRNEMVQVAREQLNRFITPFAHPDVKHTSSNTTFKVEGQIVYIATTSASPVSVFIIDKDNPINAISLTLMPRDVPAVSVALSLDEYAAPPPVALGGGGTEMYSDGGDEFVGMLRETFRAIATGEIPSGFGMKKLRGYSENMPECVMPGMQTAPAQEITNGSVIVVVSKVTNRSRIPQTVDEASCASDSVLAVAAWPHVDLMPGQSTELYVAIRRSNGPASNARPSVL